MRELPKAELMKELPAAELMYLSQFHNVLLVSHFLMLFLTHNSAQFFLLEILMAQKYSIYKVKAKGGKTSSSYSVGTPEAPSLCSQTFNSL